MDIHRNVMTDEETAHVRPRLVGALFVVNHGQIGDLL